MFNLIVTILALVLMIGAAIAGLTYLGPAFTNSQTKATVAAMLNAGEQFQGANALYKSDNGGSTVATASALVPYYLSSQPVVPAAFGNVAWTIVPSTGAGVADMVTLDLSKGANASAATAVCALVAQEVAGGPYGCTGAAGSQTFFFNL